MLVNCGAREDSWESLGLQRDRSISLEGNQSKYSLEGLKLKLQYFGHLMQRTDSLRRSWCREKLRARGEGDDRGWCGWIASLTEWTWVYTDLETVMDRQAWCAAVHGVTKNRTWLSNWTTATAIPMKRVNLIKIHLLKEFFFKHSALVLLHFYIWHCIEE